MKTNMSRRQKAGHGVKNTTCHSLLRKAVIPPPLFFKQTSYLIPLLAAISKPVLCHPIFQLDQCPTYFWVNATPPPSSGLVQSSSLFIVIRFVYHEVASVLYI